MSMLKEPAPFLPKVRPKVFPLTPAAEAAQRAAVIAEAMSWVGTPYRQRGDAKGASIDCSMLLVRCWVDAGIFEPFDPRPYPPDWHLHRAEEKYLAWMDTLAVETGEYKPGNIVLFKFGQCFSHAGILITPSRIVHAFVYWGKCSISDLFEVELAKRREKSKGVVAREQKVYDVWAKLKAAEHV